tara:strand:- start:118 stop:618 length:501 start_codon:yes stop_codon:yes gene_type:complete
MKYSIYSILILLSFNNTYAQGLDSNIVKTIDGTINETYKIITGEKGKNRNWEAFRLLFTDDAQLSVLRHDTSGKNITNTYTLEKFVRLGIKYYENDGFVEYPIKTIINEYNGIANVFQSYYAKELNYEEKGVNSFQLINDGKRWWIKSLLWTSDNNGIKIPEQLRK